MEENTKGQLERLALLAEESGELIQVLNKAIRHGLDATNPDTGKNNREYIAHELGHALWSVDLLGRNFDYEPFDLMESYNQRGKKVAPYLHFNEPFFPGGISSFWILTALFHGRDGETEHICFEKTFLTLEEGQKFKNGLNKLQFSNFNFHNLTERTAGETPDMPKEKEKDPFDLLEEVVREGQETGSVEWSGIIGKPGKLLFVDDISEKEAFIPIHCKDSREFILKVSGPAMKIKTGKEPYILTLKINLEDQKRTLCLALPLNSEIKLERKGPGGNQANLYFNDSLVQTVFLYPCEVLKYTLKPKVA